MRYALYADYRSTMQANDSMLFSIRCDLDLNSACDNERLDSLEALRFGCRATPITYVSIPMSRTS
ncbi:hypothetical protein PILCRDRAFT_716360 [Piloderma croceum F 1598]|uniref:Uncharacterized protein n=1 Tax=Piloderma croceum (strain F 1598) TaxID=765440 RepID=A0A0C3F1T5_PILCF|nr:hypothetical protein PILCRDRAFT_716360 [Piloderma croceum F 1598]